MSGTPEAPKCESVQDVKALTGIEKERERKRKQAICNKRWYQRTIEVRRAYRKKYDSEHKKERAEYQKRHRKETGYGKKHYQKNKERYAENARKRRLSGSRKDSDKKRTALIRGAKAEKFSFNDVCERCGWVCQICGKRVDKNLKYPDPMSASLDHIVPLSCGGEHTKANSQLAHLVCNISLGNRGIKQLILPVG